MKYLQKISLLFTLIAILYSCEKVDDLPYHASGTASVLNASASTIAPRAADSNNIALTLSWTYPNYAHNDPNSFKYIVEIDTTGRNFTNAVTKTVTGALSTSFLAKELNSILLGFGYAFNVPVDMDVRVISSYPNNNERLVSNVLKIRMTPYKVPPKVALPTTNRLFIIGDATDFDWENVSSMPPVRELTRLEETKWGGIFHLKGTGGYLLLPTAGSWDNKFSVANTPGLADGGDFGFNLPDNFPGTVTGGEGWYRLIFDFQFGKFSVTKVENALPANLYVTGDATAGGWTENPPATQKLTAVTNGLFEITMPLVSGRAYKFLGTAGSWQPQFGGSAATGGTLVANGAAGDPPAIPTPAAAGNYKVVVNFVTNSYTVTML